MRLAHGLGGAENLPIPASFALAGAVAALVASFLVLAVAWRRPRFDAARAGRPLPRLQAVVDSRGFLAVVRLVGLLFFGYVLWAAAAGPDLLTNPVFGVVYVYLWVGLVPASLLVGPFFKAVSPVRSVHWALHWVLRWTLRWILRWVGPRPGSRHVVRRQSSDGPDAGVLRLPRWVGYWPAAAGLLAFTWLELVWTGATHLDSVRAWFAVYLVVMLAGGLLFGTAWFERADPFEVYSTLVGHLAWVGRRTDGVVVLRWPLAGLDGVPVRPGLVAVVAVLFGSTVFDTFHASPTWLGVTQATTVNPVWTNTAALAVFCVVVGLMLVGATRWSGMGPTPTRSGLPGLFAHSVVPIVVGYVAAHYLSYFVQAGQQTLVQLSDPMGVGADLLGTADLAVNYAISQHPTALAVVRVLAVVIGHVLGVVAAHDRSLQVLPPRRRLAGQLPLLAVMVTYTFTGLSLLFGGFA